MSSAVDLHTMRRLADYILTSGCEPSDPCHQLAERFKNLDAHLNQGKPTPDGWTKPLGDTTLIVTTFTVERIENCARCGQLHRLVEAKPFTNPPESGHTHYALCETTSQPILIRVSTEGAP